MHRRTLSTTLVAAVVAVAAALALVAPAAAAATAPPAPATTAASHRHDGLTDQLNALLRTGPTGVIAEVTTPRGRREATAGVADTATGAAVPPDGRFRIGSVTKSFVATVVLQLVGEGRLALDDTVDRWLPEVVSGNGYDGRRITVRQLLQHTSGIGDYVRDLPLVTSAAGFLAARFTTYTPEQLVALGLSHPPVFAPGTGWSYSNTNYVLAGMIIQRVTGQTWRTEVRHRIIDPLGLHGTSAPGTYPLIDGPHAHGYATFGSGTAIDVTALNPSAASSAGAMISDADDLTRFYRALIGGRLLRPAELAAMEATVPGEEAGDPLPGQRYGLGLTWFPTRCGGGYFGHEGGIPGYTTWTAITPDTRRTVVASLTGDGSNEALTALGSLTDDRFCDRP